MCSSMMSIPRANYIWLWLVEVDGQTFDCFFRLLAANRDQLRDLIYITSAITLSSPISLINLLRWKDVPRTSRIFYPKIAIFPQF